MLHFEKTHSIQQKSEHEMQKNTTTIDEIDDMDDCRIAKNTLYLAIAAAVLSCFIFTLPVGIIFAGVALSTANKLIKKRYLETDFKGRDEIYRARLIARAILFTLLYVIGIFAIIAIVVIAAGGLPGSH